MKSLFLTDVQKPDLLRSALSQILPAQGETWLLLSTTGDPIAYFSIVQEKEALEVQADISGRHFHEDNAVATVLKKIGAIVGGRVRNEEEA
jgi:hypothetical protein